MKAALVYVGVVLALLDVPNCFGQQSNQFVYIEGTVEKADGSPWPGARILLSNGSTFTTNNSGHYFAIVPSGFSGTVTPSLREAATHQPCEVGDFLQNGLGGAEDQSRRHWSLARYLLQILAKNVCIFVYNEHYGHESSPSTMGNFEFRR